MRSVLIRRLETAVLLYSHVNMAAAWQLCRYAAVYVYEVRRHLPRAMTLPVRLVYATNSGRIKRRPTHCSIRYIVDDVVGVK